MRIHVLAVALTLMSFHPAPAQDTPVLTLQGLETFKLDQPPPSTTGVKGFTFKRVETVEMAEGTEYRTVYFKFFQNGHYFGKARLSEQGKIDEILIVDPLARYEGGFAVGSTWDEIQRVFPQVNLHYTYVMDKIFAASPQNKGLQVHFDTGDYTGSKPLRGEYQALAESELKGQAKAKTLRLFSVQP